MTIASAFNEIVAAQGGDPDNSGTICGALDALNDTLAGEDNPAPQTIEQGVRMLGEHISGGGGGGSFGRMGTVSVGTGESLFDGSLVIRASKTGSNIAMGSVDGSMSIAMGAYVVGAGDGIVSATYRVSDSGTPQECEVFNDPIFKVPVFGFVMPDVTDNDYAVFVDVVID